jgi:hypothetical protein
MLSLILGLLVLYLSLGASLYLYAIVQNYEILGFWVFDIYKGYIGVCKYPKWILGWLEHVVNVVTGRNVVDESNKSSCSNE